MRKSKLTSYLLAIKSQTARGSEIENCLEYHIIYTKITAENIIGSLLPHDRVGVVEGEEESAEGDDAGAVVEHELGEEQ